MDYEEMSNGFRPKYITPELDDAVDWETAIKDLDFDDNMLSSDFMSTLRLSVGEMTDIRDELKSISQKAHVVTEHVYGRSSRNDELDAFRHAYLSYQLAEKFGLEAAKMIGDGHENRPVRSGGSLKDHFGDYPKANSLPRQEILMDLYNNRAGRRLFEKYGNSGRDPVDIIKEAMKNGQFRTRPFRVK